MVAGEVIYVPEDIREELRDEVAAVNAEAGEEVPAEAVEARPVPVAAATRERESPQEKPEKVPAPVSARRDEEEDDLPQTQMAAAFAALNMEDLAIEKSPEADPA